MKYPKRLNTTREREEETGRCLRGTMDTTIPGVCGSEGVRACGVVWCKLVRVSWWGWGIGVTECKVGVIIDGLYG